MFVKYCIGLHMLLFCKWTPEPLRCCQAGHNDIMHDNRKLFIYISLLRNIAGVVTGLAGSITKKQYVSMYGAKHTKHKTQECCFPPAIRADYPKEITCLNRKRHIAYRKIRCVSKVNFVQFDHRIICHQNNCSLLSRLVLDSQPSLPPDR